MKLTNKRLWEGEKTEYYPAFKYALTDSLLFSVLWVVIISLLLSTICLIIHFTNGSNLSWKIIAFVLLFLSIVFLISNGIMRIILLNPEQNTVINGLQPEQNGLNHRRSQ